MTLLPDDPHDRRLASHVHPSDWRNPTPAKRYHLAVVGAGPAGLVAAAGAAGLGARVALIERDLMGGDCLVAGCVPSKAILAAARRVHAVRTAADLGVRPGGSNAAVDFAAVDFAAVMERMRRLRADLSPHDSATRFRELGVDVFLGPAEFLDAQRLRVGDSTLAFRRAVICTGSRAAVPDVPGLNEVPYLTNATLFGLTALPRRLGILGAGPIGCEMAQAFAAFGSEVDLFESAGGVLPRDDPDAAAAVRQALEGEGVRVRCHAAAVRCRASREGEAAIDAEVAGQPLTRSFDRLLVAAGRSPNVEGLGLERAGVAYDPRQGIAVDDFLRTSVPHIYAAGDVCTPFRFTHAADFLARIVVQNALMPPGANRARASRLVIPWCTYTWPELAHVGLTPQAAAAQGVAVRTFTEPLTRIDRAVLAGETAGMVRVHVLPRGDRIVGATIVAAGAGDMIGQFVAAMTHGVGLAKLARVIHPYPTLAEAIRKTGDAYNRTRLTPRVRRVLKWWLGR